MMKGENVRKLISVYKGHEILDVDGLITVHKDGSNFIVSLDDSKLCGHRKFIEEANTVDCAMKYIDWKEEACQSTK